MKVRSSVKKICVKCRVIKRQGVVSEGFDVNREISFTDKVRQERRTESIGGSFGGDEEQGGKADASNEDNDPDDDMPF